MRCPFWKGGLSGRPSAQNFSKRTARLPQGCLPQRTAAVRPVCPQTRFPGGRDRTRLARPQSRPAQLNSWRAATPRAWAKCAHLGRPASPSVPPLHQDQESLAGTDLQEPHRLSAQLSTCSTSTCFRAPQLPGGPPGILCSGAPQPPGKQPPPGTLLPQTASRTSSPHTPVTQISLKYHHLGTSGLAARRRLP